MDDVTVVRVESSAIGPETRRKALPSLGQSMTMSYTPAMSARAIKPVIVTLGPLTGMAQERVTSGRYASLSEVVRAGLRALEREEAALDAVLKARVEEALADPAPSLTQEDVFVQLRARHTTRTEG